MNNNKKAIQTKEFWLGFMSAITTIILTATILFLFS